MLTTNKFVNFSEESEFPPPRVVFLRSPVYTKRAKTALCPWPTSMLSFALVHSAAAQNPFGGDAEKPLPFLKEGGEPMKMHAWYCSQQGNEEELLRWEGRQPGDLIATGEGPRTLM